MSSHTKHVSWHFKEAYSVSILLHGAFYLNLGFNAVCKCNPEYISQTLVKNIFWGWFCNKVNQTNEPFKN